MKKHFKHSLAALLLITITLLGTARLNQVYSQSVTAATYTDNNLSTASGLTNCATIDYTYKNASSGMNYPQLTAVVIDDATNSTVNVWDEVNTNWVSLNLPFGGNGCRYPDVIIGDGTTTAYDYLIGVVATDLTYGYVWFFEYGVTGEGGGGTSLTVTYLSSNSNSFSVNTTAGDGPVDAAHIDVIAQYSLLQGTSIYPTCDSFAITWQSHSTGNIRTYYAKLSSPTTGTTNNIVTGLPAGALPDVAAVERFVSGTTCNNIGIYSYYDNSGTLPRLILRQYDFTAGGPVSTDTLGIKSGDNYLEASRIDGIDDYHYNYPGGDTAYYDVVANIQNTITSGADVWQFNSIYMSGENVCLPGVISIPGPLSGSYLVQHNPVVTSGMSGIYTIAYYTGAFNSYVAEAMDWFGSVYYTSPNAYLIPYSCYLPTPTVAVAGTCNVDIYPNQQLFACWGDTHGMNYKYDATPAAYVFRHAATVNKVNNALSWQLSPNPATDEALLRVSGLNGTSKLSYQLSDIMGREMMQDRISNEAQRINISALKPGLYILNLYEDESLLKTMKLVKE